MATTGGVNKSLRVSLKMIKKIHWWFFSENHRLFEGAHRKCGTSETLSGLNNDNNSNYYTA